ncbi:MAG TPA: YafY family protein [Solirubrobacterales bacterium]|nr:YafY family protein [Solirubrobacterales bacterium]
MATTTSSRLLELLSLLQARRDWPGSELSERLEVSRRTIRRDVDRLRDLGYPVESLSGPAGGYRLRAGTAMPPLLLDEEEAIAIAVGLRTAAQAAVAGIEEASVRALVKLEQVLPAHLRRRVSALGGATATLPGPGPSVDPQSLTVIASACRDRERIRFAYRGRDGEQSRRLVEPHSIVNLGRRWYLVAWDRNRLDWRTFRVDRLSSPAPAGGRFEPRTLPGEEDPAAYVAANLAGAPQAHEAVVIVHCPAAELRERPWLWGAVEPAGPDACEYRTGDDDLDWLALRVAMLPWEIEVREPPELIERLRAVRRRIGAAIG